MAATSIYFPVASWLSGSLLQDQQTGLNPDSFQITTSALGLGACEILYETEHNLCFLQSSSSPTYNPTGLQSQTSGGSSSQCMTPGLGIPVGLGPLAPRGHRCKCDYPPVSWLPSWGVWGLIILRLCPSYPSPCDSFFICLVIENLLCWSSGCFHW